jgi:CubicO group peptidase (beta-lactamase class C family)
LDGESYGGDTQTIGVVVVHKGRLVGERYRDGFGPDTTYRTWSVAKTLTGALIGVLVGRGDLQLDAPAPIGEWDEDDPRATITLRHLLNMSSGLPRAGTVSFPIYFGGADSIAEITRPPLEVAPGTRWHYANRDTLLLVRSMRSVMDDAEYQRFPYEALLWPVGMRHTTPELDAFGNFVLSSQVQSTARDLARFGLLLLQDGTWNGEQILPPGWVDFMRTPAPARSTGLVGLWRHGVLGLIGYGGQTWLPGTLPGVPADAFAAVGSRGQAIFVVPSQDLVIVRMGLDDEAGSVFFRVDQLTRDVVDALPPG